MHQQHCPSPYAFIFPLWACMPHTFRPTLTPLLDIMQLSTCLSAD
jgi:hypothetical protein